jgi:hypothetical protein
MSALPLSNTACIRNEQHLCSLEWFRSGPSIGQRGASVNLLMIASGIISRLSFFYVFSSPNR